MTIHQLITDNLDIWTEAETEKKSGRGRSSGNTASVYGIKKLRELILELAVRGKLVPQDPNDEPASELRKRIQVEKAKLIAEGKIKKTKPLEPIPKEEKPFELPRNWAWVRLGDITNFGITEKLNLISDETWILDLEDIEKDTSKLLQKFRFSDRRSLSDKNSFQAGDVLYGKLRPYLNKVIVADEAGVCTTEILPVRCYGPFGSNYFKFALKSPYFINYVNARSYGMKMPRLGTEDGRKAYFPLPPLAEQHRIVAKVDELMALCDQLETQHSNAAEAHEKLVSHLLGTLTQSQSAEDFSANWQRIAAHFDTLFATEASIDALKQTLLQLAVMGKLTDSVPKREFVDVQDLFDLIDGDRGSNYPKSHDYMDKGFCLFLSTKNVRKNGFLFDETQFLSEEKHKTLRQGLMRRGDIVITTRGTLGNVAVYDDNVIFDCVRINSGMLILRPKSFDIIAAFIMVFIQSPLFDNQLQAKRSGSAQPQIPAGILKSFTLPLFSIEDQRRIVIKVDELMTHCDKLKLRIADANQLQQKLADVMVEQAIS